MLEGLYKIETHSPMEGSIILSDASHPIFQAHFPGNPILPGFVHIEIIEKLFNIDIKSIKKAKYSGFVKPLSRVEYVKNGNRVRVFCAENEVAQFSL